MHRLLSLKQRTVRSKAVTIQAQLCGDTFRQSVSRKQWSDTAMQRAVAAVESQCVTVRRTTEMYGIPRSTLHNHIAGKVDQGAKPGRSPYLSVEEEEELVSFLIK